MDYLRIIDSDNNIYNYPDDFWIDNNGWKISSKVRNIAFAAGGKETADSYLEPRSILVKGYIRADNLYELETIERGVQRATLKGGKLYVIGDIANRYMEVTNALVKSNYTNDYRTEKQYIISFKADYPFWQNGNQSEVVAIIGATTGGEQFTVDNSESDFLVFPVITITANRGYNLPNIKLSNLSDTGMFFEYDNPSFLTGSSLVIDSREGTIKLDGVDSWEYFTTPRFLRLQNLNNIFFYEGNPCTITVTFRKVFL
jgi:hypothetical protein